MRFLDEQTKLLPISSEYYEALLADLEKYMQLVEHDVITIICDRLRKIGNMNPTSKKQISDLVRYYGSDMDKIKKAIAKRLKLSAEEVDLIFEQAATDSADFATALAMGRQDLIDTRRMEQLAMAAAKRYKDYLLNLPDTFAFKVGDQLLPIRKAYIALTNQATLAVQSGALDYSTAIRNTVKRLADNGLQVINWESGYHRRADSSVRMNVMDGVRQLNQGMLDEAGKKFATGYELSAHDRPAPDHADIQGKQYTIEQFEALNSGLKRPIGTLNCMHIAYPIIYGVTKPTYSDDELEEMKENSKKEYEWQGKKLDGYECTQKQRWYETEIRKGIDRENALKAAGDETGYRIEALKTSKLRSEYKAFSKHVGLSEKLNRTGYGSGVPGNKQKLIPEKKPAIGQGKKETKAKIESGTTFGDDPFERKEELNVRIMEMILEVTKTGHDALEFAQDNNIFTRFLYGVGNPDNLYGEYYDRIVYIYGSYHKDELHAASTFVHEITHAKINEPMSIRQEALCRIEEARFIHELKGGNLTISEIRSIIKEIHEIDVYNEYPWRNKSGQGKIN